MAKTPFQQFVERNGGGPAFREPVTIGYSIGDQVVTAWGNLGPGVAQEITIPAGTRCRQIDGAWAVDDTALIVKLTGNTHDSKYRWVWLPAFAPVAVKG